MAKRLSLACTQEQARFRSMVWLADQAHASGHRRLAIELIGSIYRMLDTRRPDGGARTRGARKNALAGRHDFEADARGERPRRR